MLKKINETMQVRMTLDEANHINALLARDEAKAVVHNEKYDWVSCPMCQHVVIPNYKFCSECGQRLDTDNYQIQ